MAFGEPRYLLPMLPLLAAAIALAVRGAGGGGARWSGPRWSSCSSAHDIFSQLQMIARYYG